jgi:hypothetical protein
MFGPQNFSPTSKLDDWESSESFMKTFRYLVTVHLRTESLAPEPDWNFVLMKRFDDQDQTTRLSFRGSRLNVPVYGVANSLAEFLKLKKPS